MNLGRRIGPRAKVLAIAGGVIMVTGSLSPWATFAGFPGKMTLAGFPGGARLFYLILARGVLLALIDLPGRRRAGVAAALGAAAVAALKIVAIANEGDALSKVAWGAWLTLGGSLVAAAGLAALPADPGRAQGAVGGHPFRRRAADAGHRAGADDRAPAPDAGRASMGLSPIIMQTIFATLSELKQQGTTLLLVEQNAQAALKLADHAHVLETGRIVLSGTGSDLLRNEQVRKAYLGED